MQDDVAAVRRGPAFHTFAFAIGVALAVAQTWPLVQRMATHFVVDVRMQDTPQTDNMLQSWILASDAHRLAHDPLHVFETNNLVPFHLTLAYAENLLGLAIPVAPVQWLWDNAVLTNNVALLSTFVLGAWGVMLLVHELTGSLAASVVAAVLTTYSPGGWANIDQIHVASGQATGFALFALVRVVRTRAWRYAVLLGLMTAWQMWSSLHWGVFLAFGLAATVVTLLLVDRDARRALPQIAAGTLLALVLAVPIALPYVVVAHEMDLHERGGFVASLLFGVPPDYVPALLHPWRYFAERWASDVRSVALLTVTPVYVAAAGLITALVLRRPRRIDAKMLAALAAGGLVDYWYALGPSSAVPVPSLYAAAAHVGLGIVRAPLRAVQYTALVLAVLAGCGLAALLRRLPWRSARAAIVVAVVAAAVVETGWRPGILVAAPPRLDPSTPALAALPPDCAIASVPDDFTTAAIGLLQSTSHWHGMLNGRSGFYPVDPLLDYYMLADFPSPDTLRYLHDAGACAIILHGADIVVTRILDRVAQTALVAVPLTGDMTLVRIPDDLPPQPPDGPLLARDGWRVVGPAGAESVLDGSLDTFHTFSVTSGDAPEALVIDLGTPQRISGVDLHLGHHWRLFMWTWAVHGSVDDVHWYRIGSSLSAVPPFASYRADRSHIVQSIRFWPSTARYLRLAPARRPPAGGPVPDRDFTFTSWGVAEIHLRGSPPVVPPAPAPG